nr:MarR family transcriptional regulator [Motilibacter aurantiacus]
MPPGQAAALGHLVRDGGLSITELAAREQVRHQSMARTVGLLVDQGLVEVVVDERDRRRVSVHLTSRGTGTLQAERLRRASAVADAARHLSDDERAVLQRVPEILRRLGDHVRGS